MGERGGGEDLGVLCATHSVCVLEGRLTGGCCTANAHTRVHATHTYVRRRLPTCRRPCRPVPIAITFLPFLPFLALASTPASWTATTLLPLPACPPAVLPPPPCSHQHASQLDGHHPERNGSQVVAAGQQAQAWGAAALPACLPCPPPLRQVHVDCLYQLRKCGRSQKGGGAPCSDSGVLTAGMPSPIHPLPAAPSYHRVCACTHTNTHARSSCRHPPHLDQPRGEEEEVGCNGIRPANEAGRRRGSARGWVCRVADASDEGCHAAHHKQHAADGEQYRHLPAEFAPEPGGGGSRGTETSGNNIALFRAGQGRAGQARKAACYAVLC